ncbi:MAG: PQQ-binding-like beta-propeller repeat protein [Acidobacteria bacterium]|nr:PQQ-binding-like beta-propeller repeat protein [Acidobacteriota bacterium]
MRHLAFFVFLHLLFAAASGQTAWEQRLDSRIAFYQTTDFGIVLAGTDKDLYAVDGQTGERIWRRETGRIHETAITPIPGTDVILVSRDLGSKSRLEAVDLLSGRTIWRSEKLKGDVLQLAADPANDLLAVVMVKDTRGKYGSEMKREPVTHMLRMSDGEELWKKTLRSDVEMMPSRFGEDLGEIDFTLDNYRAPLLIDDRLYLFYEGVTIHDARTGKEIERERFKVNESGLALTEADPTGDENSIYVSGRGRIRAVDRRSGEVRWRSDDLGNCAEMILIGEVLYVRTGGRFTRLRDGKAVAKGPYGVSAIDTRNGKTLWRYKGADKGLTNFAFLNAETIVIADRDDLTTINAHTGKRIEKFEHKIDDAAFVLINEMNQPVVGGKDELAAFSGTREAWRVRHKAPARGVLRIIGGIALRASALYFRYGGMATSAIGFARSGIGFLSSANSFRWSGIGSRFGSFDLTTLAANSARNFGIRQIYSFGSLGGLPDAARRLSGFQVLTPSGFRSSVAGRLTPSAGEVRESIADRLDPARYAERLSSYLLRRKRVAELRGSYMYFYTDLTKPFDRKGLVGVNVHTGRDARYILASDPDEQFVTDEVEELLYSADGNKLQAFNVLTER